MSQRGMLDENEIPDCAATLNGINQAVNLINDNGDCNIIALKGAVATLTELVHLQNCKTEELQYRQDRVEGKTAKCHNVVEDIEDRVLELERYSRKTCLIFNSFDVGENVWNTVLNHMNNVLQVRIESWDLAACHSLNNEKVAPVIVKFLYHRHRDLVRRRKSFLRNIKNSKDLPIFVEECLAPSDRKLKVEASRMNLSTFTRKQDVYVFNENSSISGAVKVKDVTDLDAFKKHLCAENNS